MKTAKKSAKAKTTKNPLLIIETKTESDNLFRALDIAEKREVEMKEKTHSAFHKGGNMVSSMAILSQDAKSANELYAYGQMLSACRKMHSQSPGEQLVASIIQSMRKKGEDA